MRNMGLDVNRNGRAVSGTIWTAILILILLSPAILVSQVVTSTIIGRVSDSTGAVIAGAKVAVQNTDTGESRSAETDSAGRYSVSNLAAGSYSVTVQASGFQTAIRRGITLSVASEVVINLEMVLGSVQETVQVTAEAPVIEATSATLSGLVNPQQLRDLPLNGRSFDQLALLSAGVVAQPEATRNQIQGQGLRLGSNGARADANLYLLDGTVINDHSSQGPGSAAGQNLGVEAIREFRILTHSFSAEYGRNAGAVVSAITRSGTKEFHGSAYEFLRNNVLDARNFFDKGSVPPFRRNQFGGSLGGPLLRERAFFFVNYEGLRQRRGVTVIASVPDANARQGVLPGGTVAVNPAIKPYLDLYPLPNGRSFGDGTAEYIQPFSSSANENYSMERMDLHLSNEDNLFARYVYDPSESRSPRPLPGFYDGGVRTNHFTALGETHIFSATALNDFRFAFNRTDPGTTTGSLQPTGPALSFLPGADFGTITFTTAAGTGGLQLTELGTQAVAPQTFTQNVFQVTDAVNYVRGPHSWKVGMDVQRVQLNTNYLSWRRGNYTFTSLSDLLNARPSQFQFAFIGGSSSPVRGWRQVLVGSFVQDDVRLRHNLTLNLGLRHELVTSPAEVNGKSADLLHVTDAESTIGPPFETRKTNFAPRAGLAWDPTGSGKMSVRVGGGMFYNPVLGRDWYFFSGSDYRFTSTIIIANAPFPNALQNGFAAGAKSTNAVQFELDTPALVHYNVEIQRQLAPSLVLRAGYIGSHGYHMTRATEQNIRVAQIQPDGSKFFPTNARFRNPNFSSIGELLTDAHSNYNALQIDLQKSMSAGLQFNLAYTVAKTLSDSDSISNSQITSTAPTTLDINDLARDYSRSVYDQRQTVVFNAQYQMPWDKNLKSVATRAIFGGWAVNGIVSYGSGFPFDVQLGFNNSQNGDRNQPDRPNLAPGASNDPIHGTTAGCAGVRAGQKLRTPDRYFDPCSFQLPPAGTFGNLARNTVTGPRLFNVDFAALKTLGLGEKVNLEFRAEFFNLFNHANFSAPSRFVFTSQRVINGNAGRITTTSTTEREIQFGLKLIF